MQIFCPKRVGRWRLAAAGIAFVFLLAGLLAVLLWPEGLPSFSEVRKGFSRSEAVLLDRHGEVIHELRVDRRGRRLEWVPLQEISPALQSAVIAAEDRRFYRHRGVNWTSLGSAGLGLVRGSTARGASTITMQLVSKLDEDLRPQRLRRTILQKLEQIVEARVLENKWTKAEILEAYLNLVTFRGELQGIASASRGLFRKEPQGLDSVEALILAALIRSPNAGIDSVSARACVLSKDLNLQAGRDEILSGTGDALSRPYLILPQASLAPHVALRLLEAGKAKGDRIPGRIRCTLDARLQSFVSESLRRHLITLRALNVRDGAALVVDNRSGEVLAYVGNIGDQASARYVDGTQALRQAGSTLKPFLYGMALDRRLITPVSLIDDSPTEIPVTGGVYRPKNYDNVFHGLVTARVALASSLNVPAVKTLNLVGVDSFLGELRLLGFRDLGRADFYGPSLALGSADITLWDLVGAYRALANGGVWNPLRLSFEAEADEARRVLSADAAFLVADILSDRESRSRTFSLESPLSTRFWTAVKTGTSKDMRDNWCVGYSERYTVGVWAGNFSGEPMWNVSGITGAAPVWVEIMNWLQRSGGSSAPAAPSGVVASLVQVPAIGMTHKEWFIRGTETKVVRPASPRAGFRIVYPAQGTVIALDPDIPPQEQKVFLEASPEGNGLQWLMDNKPLGPAGSLLLWTPLKGKHELALADESGRTYDSISLEVR